VTVSRSEWRATLSYTVPFLAYVSLLEVERLAALPPELFYPIRFVVVLALLLALSRGAVTLRPSFPRKSIAVGATVFLIWIGPDILFGYRHHWLFENRIFGYAVSSIPSRLHASVWLIGFRILSSAALVPVLEELFWRGWLMRWLITLEFQKVPLGQYAPLAFWFTAALFASEHGPYWDVGFAAGVIYNWWIVRCRNLADCMVAHAVTNALLAAYVVAAGQWQYWL